MAFQSLPPGEGGRALPRVLLCSQVERPSLNGLSERRLWRSTRRSSAAAGRRGNLSRSRGRRRRMPRGLRR